MTVKNLLLICYYKYYNYISAITILNNLPVNISLVKIHVIINCIRAHDGDITRIQFTSYARRLPTRCSWPQFVEETFFGLLSRRNSICHEISYHDSHKARLAALQFYGR